MATVNFEKQDSIVKATVFGALRESDFEKTIRPAVEKILNQKNKPEGVLLDTGNFEGWENFSAFVRHMEFIRDYHHNIKKLAIEGTAQWQEALKPIANLISDTEIKFFSPGQDAEAKSWLQSAQ